jgi:GntR family transcriptional regulator
MATTKTRSQRLHEDLGQIIAAAKPGDRLLSEPLLARQLGVSRATLREAMRTFETQGLIRRRQGSGTYVVHPSQVIETGLEVLESIETLARRIGLPVSMGEMKIDYRPARDEEVQALCLNEPCNVLHLSRVILAEGRPVAFLIDILPEDILTPQDLEPGFTGSVLDLLLQRGTPSLATSRTEINAVTASPEVARALGIQRGDVLLRFSAFLFTDLGRVVDYSFSYFLPGYFRFHVIRRVGHSFAQGEKGGGV